MMPTTVSTPFPSPVKAQAVDRKEASKEARGGCVNAAGPAAAGGPPVGLAAEAERCRAAAARQPHALAAAAQNHVDAPRNIEFAVIEGAGIAIVADLLQGGALRRLARGRGAGGAQHVDGIGAAAVVGPAARVLLGAGGKPDRSASRP